ncbi:MAG: glycosyltransferase family 2 protein [Anaerolinea sp.]|nr:glycosyltransferase family 2 protein [Anaerolinea sp.]
MKDRVLSIVIPIHNRKQLTRDCLLSLHQQTVNNFNTIVIDDGSTDGTSEMIRKEFSEVVLLHGDGNLWWTGATNRGVKYALDQLQENDYILTLNNDTVVGPDYLETLLRSAINHPKCLIGSISINAENKSMIVDAGIRMNWFTAKATSLGEGRRYEELCKLSDTLVEVDVLPGRGTLIPVRAFLEMGLYDAVHLPHYGSDYEFSIRAKRNGYQLLVDYRAVVISEVRATGLNNQLRSLSWTDWVRSFFSIRSPINLRYRWNFARLACPKMLLPIFIPLDTIRVVFGSFRNQLKTDRGHKSKSDRLNGETDPNEQMTRTKQNAR